MNDIKSFFSRSIVSATLLGLSAAALSPSAEAIWPTSSGGAFEDQVEDSAVTPNGDVVVAGRFAGEALFGSETFITSRGGDDIFVARYSQTGSLQWVVRAGSSRNDGAIGVAVDDAGFIYVTGTYIGDADFGPNDLSSNGLEEDVFVAKLTDDGTWVWVEKASGQDPDFVTGIGVVPGNPTTIPQTPATVVIAGHYQCGLRLQQASTPSEPAVNLLLGQASCGSGIEPDQHFLAGIDSDGRWRWAFDDGANGSNATRILDLDVAEDGRTVAIGEHSGALSLGGTSLPATTAGGADFTPVEGAWSLISTPYNGGVAAYYIPNTPGRALNRLRLDEVFDFTDAVNPRLSFQNRFRLDLPGGTCYDVAFLQYSTNGGSSWTRFSGSSFLQGGYNGSGNGFENNPASGEGWCSTSPGWPNMRTVEVDLGFLVGQPNVQFQWVLAEGDAVGTDGFYIDDVEVFSGAQRIYSDDFEPSTSQFVARISNVNSGLPSWSWVRSVPDELALNAIDQAVNSTEVYLAGTLAASVSLPEGDSTNLVNPGAAIIEMDGNSGFWVYGRSATGGEATAITVVDNDASPPSSDGVYISGSFTGSTTFTAGPDGTIQAEAERDIFVAKAAFNNLSFEWVSGGDRYASGGVPGRAGGPGDAVVSTLSTDGLANLYVGGNFSGAITFGEEASLFASSGRNVYLANLNLSGIWFEVQTWIVGEPVPPPQGADLSSLSATPEIFIDDELALNAIGSKFFWGLPPNPDDPLNTPSGVLTALDALDGVRIEWRVAGEPPGSDQRISSVGRVAWPTDPCNEADDSECYQVHISGAPVELDQAGSAFRYLNLFLPAAQSNQAEVNAGVLTAEEPGFTVLMYVEGTTTDPFSQPLSIEVVRTFDAPQSPNYVRNIRWDIGEPVVEPFHNELGRNGYVLNENAFYDGVGSDAAYDREARTGDIIPVNKVRPNRLADADKELTVAWYRRNAMGIYWPQRAINYAPDWPLDPERIIIASQTGAEVLGQQPLSPIQFPDLRIYQQPVINLPGYNPNATHALFRPSNTGSGILALFALRADFGINLPGDLTSATDPYVLIKYWNEALDRWAYRVFYVTATGAGFDGFQFGGEAGTAVLPPYPLSTLPNCQESRAVGEAANDLQPPPPFFRDYKNGLWSKSAGSRAMRYWYPLQDTFYFDPNNDGFPDAFMGQCIPWMARLPEAQGGSESSTLPIEVDYVFTWPADAPQLTPGETLLKQKRGLPNIFQQDAVEVIYDQYREDLIDANMSPEPEDNLVQLMDPLNPRFVVLDSDFLEDVASELDPATGFRVIVGSGDSLLSLPVSIRDRLRYDPINNRLIFSGVFDDSLAGEPLLLLNVMSFREARQLKVMDGSAPDAAEDSNKACQSLDDECGWSQAIEALFRLTRNPNGIRKICTDSQINPSSGERTCITDRPPARGELLVAFQDPFIEFNFDNDPDNDVPKKRASSSPTRPSESRPRSAQEPRRARAGSPWPSTTIPTLNPAPGQHQHHPRRVPADSAACPPPRSARTRGSST
jgi:hypothetical protein